MTQVLMACGIPCVGKSTWLGAVPRLNPDAIRISSDDFIEQVARSVGKTYDQVFSEVIEQANDFFWRTYEMHLRAGTPNIILDRTFLVKSSRKRAISMARQFKAEISAVSFALPMTQEANDEWNRRLIRPGKSIPNPILVDMIQSFVEPTTDEGFVAVTRVNTFKYID
jgi:predicted kinase